MPAGLRFQWARARKAAATAAAGVGFELPRLEAQAAVLSGGNLQRLVFARELTRRPDVLVCFSPTHGMDVPSANAAREVILDQSREGAAVLLISDDLDELFAMSDRLAVMHNGRIVGVFEPSKTTPEAVGFLMTGASVEDPDD